MEVGVLKELLQSIGCLYEDSNAGGTGKIYRKSTDGGNTGWIDATDSGGGGGGGGGSFTVSNIDSMYEELYISDSGDKLLNITNYIGENFVKNIWSNSGNLNTARYVRWSWNSNAGIKFWRK